MPSLAIACIGLVDVDQFCRLYRAELSTFTFLLNLLLKNGLPPQI